MSMVGQFLFAGLSIGGVYALVALGFVMIFRATNVVNFAQGEFSMLGAYFLVALWQGLDLIHRDGGLLGGELGRGDLVVAKILLPEPMLLEADEPPPASAPPLLPESVARTGRCVIVAYCASAMRRLVRWASRGAFCA